MLEVYNIDILCKTSEIGVEYCAINDDFLWQIHSVGIHELAINDNSCVFMYIQEQAMVKTACPGGATFVTPCCI